MKKHYKVDLINYLKDKVDYDLTILWTLTIDELLKLKEKVLEVENE